MGLLAGKVAVITGASRGLGLAMAQAFAEAGAAVVLGARSLPALEEAVKDLHARGYKAAAARCDVSQQGEVVALRELALGSFGRLDIWVNNAGVGGVYGPTLEISPEDFERTLHTNVLGTYYGSLAAMDHFVKQGFGKLINITGRGDTAPVPMQNAYASSKIWIRWFSRALAKETHGKGVEVILLNPGMMTTDLLTRVEVVAGHEQALKVLPMVIRMLAVPPEFSAARAVQLASSQTDGRTGLEVHATGPLHLLLQAAREGLRWVAGKRDLPKLNSHSVPPDQR